MTIGIFRVDRHKWELFKKLTGNASAALRKFVDSYLEIEASEMGTNIEKLALQVATQKTKVEEEEIRFKMLEAQLKEKEAQRHAKEEEMKEAVKESEAQTFKGQFDKLVEGVE